MIASPILEAKPGDVWLYSRTDVVSRLIAMKTWSRYTHVEIAFVNRRKDSGLELFTSRITDGVEFYPPDLSGLALVLRSRRPFNQVAATTWANSVVGQPYDLLGLSAFWFAELQGKENGRQFCSEACARVLRRGWIDLFPGADCDAIAPSYYSHNPRIHVVWRSTDEWRRWHARHPEEIA